jgi:hypothetical protein
MNTNFRSIPLQTMTLVTALVIAIATYPATARTDGAQSGDHPFQIGVGAYFPTDHDAQQLVHTVYKIEAVYDLGHGSTVPLSVYGGYGWGSHAVVQGVNVGYSNYWLGVQGRTASPVYGGLGLGYYGQAGTLNVSGFGSASATQGGVGGTVFLGADFGAKSHQTQKPGLGIRLGYNVLPNFEGLNTDGYDFTIRYRI